MKNKIIVLILSTLFLYSCETSPVIDNKGSFVVTEIKVLNEWSCTYKSDKVRSSVGMFYGSIILPKGLYNVGDTIKPNDFKK